MRSDRMVAVVATALLATSVQAGCRSAPADLSVPQTAPSTAGPDVRASAGDPALAVLHAWDRLRAAAWADADAVALGRLYLPGSAAGERDVRLLRDYRGRGLHVTGIRTQVLAAEVSSQETDRLVVAVTERFAGAVAVGPRTRVTLPRGTPRDRVVVLVRRLGRWVVAAVREP
ncbi:MAG: hypothetical protein ABIQ15_11360 [Nocardioides sp.]